MKSGLSDIELVKTIDAQNMRKQDIIVPTAQIEMLAADALLSVPGFGTFRPTAHAHRQVADRIGIPSKYYDRMLQESPELLRENVNHWFQTNPEKRLLRTFVAPPVHTPGADPSVVAGVGTARAFLSDRYRALDNEQVAAAVLPVISEGGLKIASANITEKSMYIKAYDPSMEKVIRRGDGLGYGQGHDFRAGGARGPDDVVHWGVAITNSEVGSGALKVESFMFRTYCLNGLIFEQVSRRHHVGRVMGGDDDISQWFADDTVKADDEAFFLKMRDTVRGTLAETSFDAAVDKLSESTGRKIEGDVAKAVDVTAKHISLTDGEKGGVLRHLIEGGDLTAWGMLNAVTRTAEDSDSYDRATELEAAGMKVVNMTGPQWQEVAHA